MQDAVLVLRRSGDVHLFVRRSSYERTMKESPLANVHAIQSYCDMRAVLPKDLGNHLYRERAGPTSSAGWAEKYFTIFSLQPLDGILSRIRAVKSPYELKFLYAGGREHDELLIPCCTRPAEGGHERGAALWRALYRSMMEMNRQGIVRFSGFGNEMQIGHIWFGTTTLFSTSFDGSGGMRGESAIVPSVGGPRPMARFR